MQKTIQTKTKLLSVIKRATYSERRPKTATCYQCRGSNPNKTKTKCNFILRHFLRQHLLQIKYLQEQESISKTYVCSTCVVNVSDNHFKDAIHSKDIHSFFRWLHKYRFASQFHKIFITKLHFFHTIFKNDYNLFFV